MSEESPWAPRPATTDASDADEAATDGPVTGGAGADGLAAGRSGADATMLLGLAVVLGALAGICALLGGHFVLGALRLAAGILAGAAVGAGVLALLGLRRGRAADAVEAIDRDEAIDGDDAAEAPAASGARTSRGPLLLAGALAAAVALALTVPSVLATRIAPLNEVASVRLAALEDGDVVHAVPGTDGPLLLRRADGSAQLVDDSGARDLPAEVQDVLALTADGTRAVRTDGTTTAVLSLAAGAPDSSVPDIEVPGAPLSLDGDQLVVRHCEDGACRLSGYDLTAPEQALWTVLDGEAPGGEAAAGEDSADDDPAGDGTAGEGSAGGDATATRGPDPAGQDVPARPETAPGLLDAVASTGVLPIVPLRFDAAQGWTQLDPGTGFPVGRVLAPADAECRVAATLAPADPQALRDEPAQVLTVCADEEGALVATAYRDGEVLWQSDASPAGEWTVRIQDGRVLATGTETGTDTAGEMIASEAAAAWTAPGGEGTAQASEFTSRLGIDTASMVVTNDAGQLVAYDTVTGANTWTLPLASPDAAVRGVQGAGTVVVLDEIVREHPLDPRGAQRLRVIDVATGEVRLEREVAGGIGELRPLPGGRALVTVGEEALLLGG